MGFWWGCAVSVVAVSGSIVSNTVTLPIATGGGACVDPVSGMNGNTYQTLNGQGTVKTGVVYVAHSINASQANDFAGASFQSETGAIYGASGETVSTGGCVVSQYQGTTATTVTSTPLDAGAISVTGPTGTVSLTAASVGSYYYFQEPAAGFFPASGGTFTFKGGGGTNVGSRSRPR